MGAARDPQPHIALAIGQLTFGGAETQLCELVEGLRPECRVTVYCLSGRTEPLGERVKASGAELVAFPSGGGFDLRRVRALRQQIVADRPDVVHAFLYIADAYVWAATLAMAGRPPLVASARNCKVEKDLVRRVLVGKALRSADTLVCNSEQMAAFAAANYGVDARRTRVVYNGVDVQRFRVGESSRDGALRIGTVGRIEEQKNLGLFLEVARKFLIKKPNTVFEIVGDGSLRAHFEAQVAALSLGANVRFLGVTSAVPEFLSSLDQFWLTSDWEGTPNVVLEAMASGVAVVATAVGGTPELIDDGSTGSLVAAGDAEAFLDAALAYATNPGLRAKVGAAARSAVMESFSIHAMVETTKQVYRSIGVSGLPV